MAQSRAWQTGRHTDMSGINPHAAGIDVGAQFTWARL
jgi:hypothetical protein